MVPICPLTGLLSSPSRGARRAERTREERCSHGACPPSDTRSGQQRSTSEGGCRSSRQVADSGAAGHSVAPIRHDVWVFPVELMGEKVVLREISVADLDAALAFASDPKVTRHLRLEPQSREQELAAIKSMVATARATPRTQFELAAIERSSGAMVGMGRIGLTPGPTGNADIGYVLRRDCWGRGLGTDVAGSLVAFGFRELSVHRVWAGHHPDNG